ncbi:MAG TPA: DUF4189 domain-containing protein [Rhizomicrobium sp.]|jgi:hypothetical protein
MKLYILAGALCLAAAPAMALSFTSIALSPNTGAWGKAYGFATRGEADRTAIGYCRQHSNDPDDCRVVTWSRGEYCASVAVHHKHDGSVVWGSASGPTKDVAEAKAYDNCVSERGKRCDEILATVCSH